MQDGDIIKCSCCESYFEFQTEQLKDIDDSAKYAELCERCRVINAIINRDTLGGTINYDVDFNLKAGNWDRTEDELEYDIEEYNEDYDEEYDLSDDSSEDNNRIITNEELLNWLNENEEERQLRVEFESYQYNDLMGKAKKVVDIDPIRLRKAYSDTILIPQCLDGKLMVDQLFLRYNEGRYGVVEYFFAVMFNTHVYNRHGCENIRNILYIISSIDVEKPGMVAIRELCLKFASILNFSYMLAYNRTNKKL